MNNKLKCVLLVDDDPTTSFITKVILQQANCTERIEMVNNGKEALSYLQSDEGNANPRPDLILLDTNMPIMDGWVFIDEYKKVGSKQKMPIIIMLSSSINEADRARAGKISEINDFIEKPFNHESIEMVLNKHFSETTTL